MSPPPPYRHLMASPATA